MKLFKQSNISENTSIVNRNISISLLIKGLSLIIAFFTTPAYLQYFGSKDVLGLWFTILSVLAWILNGDMGIGNGLRNNIVYSINKQDWKETKSYISSAYIFLFTVGGFIIIALIPFVLFADWNRVFHIAESLIDKTTLRYVLLILLVSIILQFVLRLITSILYAIQNAFLPSLLNLITNVVLLLYVVISNRLNRNDNILLLSIVYLIAVNLPLIIATIIVFSGKLKQAKPSFSYYERDYANSVLKVGVSFLWLQLIAMIVDNTNNYLISIFINNASVVEYQIYYKLFSIPLTIMIIVSTSIWSTITKAKAEGNWDWIASNYKKSIKLLLILSIFTFVAIIPLQSIFNLWLGKETISVNYVSALLIALSTVIMCLRTVLSGFSNGLYEIRLQLIYMTIGAVLNIPLAYFISLLYNHYLAIVVANIISMIPFCIAQLIWCHNNIIKKQKGELDEQF